MATDWGQTVTHALLAIFANEGNVMARVSKPQRGAWSLSNAVRQTVRRSGLFAAVVLAAATIGFGAQAASAAYPVQTAPLNLGQSSPSPSPGATVTVQGSGYAPGARVSIDVHSTVIHLTTVTADASGFMRATVTLPASLPSGSHELTATGPAAGGGTNTLSLSFNVAGGSLPFTGAPVVLIGGAGLLAAAVGAALILYARRRQTA